MKKYNVTAEIYMSDCPYRKRLILRTYVDKWFGFDEFYDSSALLTQEYIESDDEFFKRVVNYLNKLSMEEFTDMATKQFIKTVKPEVSDMALKAEEAIKAFNINIKITA